MIYFTDRALNIIGQASYDLPEGLIIADDRKTEDVDTGVVTFECKIPFTSATRNLVETCTACGNYILRDGEDDSEFYTIIDSETDTKKREVYLYAEDAGLDLLNEITGAYAATEAHPIAWYIERFTGDTGFEIGFNEAADLSRTLSWDGESTITERLASVASQFDCELSYSFAVEGLQLTHKYINIYRERGNDAGVSLRLNYEIDNIITSSSIANLATALHPTGGTPEGAEMPITLVGYSYDDGDIYLENGYLKSREAVKKWSRYLNPTEPDQNYTGHILRTYSYETTDQSVLCAHAITELKKVREVEINYEVDITDLPENVRIGDRVNVIDDAGELYVSSRILKLETSIANHKRTATLGEYLIKDSGINQKVIDLASAFAAKAQETARAYAAAQAAQEAANNVRTDLDNNYTDTTGMSDAINIKFGQITLSVVACTGEDEGKYLVKVNDGGDNKQGTIDLTGLVKFTDLETTGSTVINGANITAGTLTLNSIQSESGNDVLTMDNGGFQVVSQFEIGAGDPQTTTYKLVNGEIQGVGQNGLINSRVGVNSVLGIITADGTEMAIGCPTTIDGELTANGFNLKHLGAHSSAWGNYGRIIATNYTFSYHANTVITLLSPTSVMIKMSGKMGTDYNSSSYVRYGLSIPMLNSQISSLLSSLGYTLNTVTYLPKSQWLAWKVTDGTLLYNRVDYGTCYQIDTTDGILRPARVYTTNGDVGGWGIDTWYTGGFYFDTTIFADITLL